MFEHVHTVSVLVWRKDKTTVPSKFPNYFDNINRFKNKYFQRKQSEPAVEAPVTKKKATPTITPAAKNGNGSVRKKLKPLIQHK